MKAAGRLIALGLVCALMLAAPWAMKTAVVDVRERIQPKTAEWEGVISAAVVHSFPTVNVSGWLNACFRAFEKQQGNVLISLRDMTEIGVQTGAAAGTLPDVLLYGMNGLAGEEGLFVRMEGDAAVKAGLQNAGVRGGERYAVPVAMGGYGLLGNRKLLDAAGWSPELSFEETMELLQEKGMAVGMPLMEHTSPLAAFQKMGDAGQVAVMSDQIYEKVWPDFALEGKYAFYVATQREIRRMQVLQSAGRGFETVLVVPDAEVYVDQVLLCGMVRPELTASSGEDSERAEWIGRLMRFLLEEEQQGNISQAGLFPVTGVQGVYEAGTQMAQLERALQEGLVLNGA